MGAGQFALGSWVRLIRSRMGLRQHKFAGALGVHWTTVSRWERDLAEPRPAQLEAAATLYLTHVADPERWPDRRPVQFHRAQRTVRIADAGGTVIGNYLREGARRGKKVVVIHQDDLELDALDELTGGAWTGTPALADGQLTLLPTSRVFSSRSELIDPSQVLAHGHALETRAREDGFDGTWWLADLRPVTRMWGAPPALLALEHAMDAVMRARPGSHAFALFPRSSLSVTLRACLICLTPQAATEHEVITNPFYADPNLCLAMRLHRGAHGDTKGGCRGGA